MARQEMQWSTFASEVGPLAADTSGTFLVFENPEGVVNPGEYRLLRMMGVFGVSVSSFVTGQGGPHVWAGIINTDRGQVGNVGIIQNATQGNDSNLGSWVWREPLNPPSVAMVGAVTTVTWWHRFDWAMRGGKGTECRIGNELRLVIQHARGNATDLSQVRVDFSCMALFSGT